MQPRLESSGQAVRRSACGSRTEPRRAPQTQPTAGREALPLFLTSRIDDVLGEIVLDFGTIPHHLVVSVIQNLIGAIAQVLADVFLHARIVEIALARRFFRNEFEDAVIATRMNDGGNGAGLQR